MARPRSSPSTSTGPATQRRTVVPSQVSSATTGPVSPWLLPDGWSRLRSRLPSSSHQADAVTSPAFSVQRCLPSPNLSLSPRSHSRSGSSSGDHPSHSLGRLSFRPPCRKLSPESDAINQQLEIKRLLSKPAAPVPSFSQPAPDEKPLPRPRRAASSDNATHTWHRRPSTSDHPASVSTRRLPRMFPTIIPSPTRALPTYVSYSFTMTRIRNDQVRRERAMYCAGRPATRYPVHFPLRLRTPI